MLTHTKSDSRISTMLVAFLISCVALLTALYIQAQPQVNGHWAALPWLVALTAFVAGCWSADRTNTHTQPLNLAWAGVDTLLLLGVAGIAFAVRFIALGTAPVTMLGDEGSMGMEAVRVLRGDITNPFATGWLSHPTMWFYVQAFGLRVFGDSLAGLRTVSVLIGTATVATTYLLARLLYNRPIALLAAVLLATYHLHLHFSRVALNNVADPFFGTLVLIALVVGLRTRRYLPFALMGVTLGYAQYFYHGARLFVVLGLALGLLALAREWKQRHEWSPRFELTMPLLVAAGAFIAAAPLLYTFISNPGSFGARFDSVGVNPEWLRRHAEATGQSPFAVLLEQFRRAALAFHLYPDVYGFYEHRRPLLWGVGQILMPIGLLIAVFRGNQWAYQVPLLWLLLGITFGGALFQFTPGSPRYVTLAPVVCLLCAFTLHTGFRLFQTSRINWFGIPQSALTVLVLAMCIASPISYFYDFLVYEQMGRRVTHAGNALARYLEQQPPGTDAWLLGSHPGMYRGLSMLPFLARQVEGHDVDGPLLTAGDVPLPAIDTPTVYAITPERIAEFELIEQTYPGGEFRALYWKHDPEPMIYVYTLYR